jgi:hypothetical protein
MQLDANGPVRQSRRHHRHRCQSERRLRGRRVGSAPEGDDAPFALHRPSMPLSLSSSFVRLMCIRNELRPLRLKRTQGWPVGWLWGRLLTWTRRHRAGCTRPCQTGTNAGAPKRLLSVGHGFLLLLLASGGAAAAVGVFVLVRKHTLRTDGVDNSHSFC